MLLKLLIWHMSDTMCMVRLFYTRVFVPYLGTFVSVRGTFVS